MILSITTALMIQAAPLPVDQAAAATTCMATIGWGDEPKDRDWFVAFTYLGFVAAPGEKGESVHAGFVVAVNAARVQMPDIASHRGPLLKACRQRFPLAWSSSATLPHDQFERRFFCAVITGVYQGLLDELPAKFVPADELRRVRAKEGFFRDLVTNAEAVRSGMDGYRTVFQMAQSIIRKSVNYGNARALNNACEAAFPS